MKALFVALQDASTRRWSPVGKLTRVDDGYRFAYTKGVGDFPNFAPFGRMRDVNSTYFSKELFPLFLNRVLAKNRPEHAEYLDWLGLSGEAHDELEELSRTGGLRATDSIELIPCPFPSEDGFYEEFFFCRGLSHLPQESRERATGLRAGERLFVMADVQNLWDPKALALRTDDPVSIVGYAPAYFSRDFTDILNGAGSKSVTVTVEKVNHRAPSQYRLLCRFRAPWPKDFSPCSGEKFQEIASRDTKLSVSLAETKGTEGIKRYPFRPNRPLFSG